MPQSKASRSISPSPSILVRGERNHAKLVERRSMVDNNDESRMKPMADTHMSSKKSSMADPSDGIGESKFEEKANGRVSRAIVGSLDVCSDVEVDMYQSRSSVVYSNDMRSSVVYSSTDETDMDQPESSKTSDARASVVYSDVEEEEEEEGGQQQQQQGTRFGSDLYHPRSSVVRSATVQAAEDTGVGITVELVKQLLNWDDVDNGADTDTEDNDQTDADIVRRSVVKSVKVEDTGVGISVELVKQLLNWDDVETGADTDTEDNYQTNADVVRTSVVKSAKVEDTGVGISVELVKQLLNWDDVDTNADDSIEDEFCDTVSDTLERPDTGVGITVDLVKQLLVWDDKSVNTDPADDNVTQPAQFSSGSRKSPTLPPRKSNELNDVVVISRRNKCKNGKAKSGSHSAKSKIKSTSTSTSTSKSKSKSGGQELSNSNITNASRSKKMSRTRRATSSSSDMSSIPAGRPDMRSVVYTKASRPVHSPPPSPMLVRSSWPITSSTGISQGAKSKSRSKSTRSKRSVSSSRQSSNNTRKSEQPASAFSSTFSEEALDVPTGLLEVGARTTLFNFNRFRKAHARPFSTPVSGSSWRSSALTQQSSLLNEPDTGKMYWGGYLQLRRIAARDNLMLRALSWGANRVGVFKVKGFFYVEGSELKKRGVMSTTAWVKGATTAKGTVVVDFRHVERVEQARRGRKILIFLKPTVPQIGGSILELRSHSERELRSLMGIVNRYVKPRRTAERRVDGVNVMRVREGVDVDGLHTMFVPVERDPI